MAGKTLEELKKRMFKIRDSINYALDYCPDSTFDMSANRNDPDEQLFISEFDRILERLEDIKYDLDYLDAPVSDPETLHKNKNGRYATPTKEFSSGNHIEYLIEYPLDPTDSPEMGTKWERGRIEHNGADYYMYKHPEITLEGLTVRLRVI